MPRKRAQPEPRVKCRYCGRMICVNRLTGGLRFHRVPEGVDTGVFSVVPGDACPGSTAANH